MSRQHSNKETVRNAIAALNDRDLDRFFSFHTDDTTSHEVFYEDPLPAAEFRAFLEDFLRAYPDAHIETRAMLAEGDTVAVENVLTATFSADLRGTRATGRSYSVREAVFFELRDGLIAAARIYLDQKSVERQLGLS